MQNAFDVCILVPFLVPLTKLLESLHLVSIRSNRVTSVLDLKKMDRRLQAEDGAGAGLGVTFETFEQARRVHHSRRHNSTGGQGGSQDLSVQFISRSSSGRPRSIGGPGRRSEP